MALVLVLAVLVLVTFIVVAAFSLATTERSSARLTLERAQAEVLADMAADIAMGRISDATVQGSQPGKSWASEPGRIWIFDIRPGSGTITRESVDLFSALPGADPNNVDLNAPSLAGEFPIAPPAPGEVAANMKVGWLDVLQDPSSPASEDNQIIGRVAFWVDDESAKVNINTADGSMRGATPAEMAHSGRYSFGFGTPSEINLAALPGLDEQIAAAIADRAWEQEFHSIEELTRVTGGNGNPLINIQTVDDLRFDITDYNSSPDLNFMGEPRINLLPATLSADLSSDPPRPYRLNTILGPYQLPQAMRQNQGLPTAPQRQGMILDHIYPQPSQLPRPPYLPNHDAFHLHTLALNSNTQRIEHTGNNIPPTYRVGQIITQYLTGRNLRGETFTWPRFPGADSNGFAGKYTTRQLDSITLQILDTAGKSPLADQHRVYSHMSIMDEGWLSGEPIMGVGRAPKLTEILIDATLTMGDPFGYGTPYPLLQVQMVSEYYFPTGFAGMPTYTPFEGSTTQWGFYPQEWGGGSGRPGTSHPNLYDNPRWDASITPQRPSAPSISGTLWADVMLRAVDQNGNHAGIDILGNTRNWPDPDQQKAELYHPYAFSTETNQYHGGALSTANRRTAGFLEYTGFLGGNVERGPGLYYSRRNRFPTVQHAGRPEVTFVRLLGGLLYASRDESGPRGYRSPMHAPFDAFMPVLMTSNIFNNPPDMDQIKESLIPVDLPLDASGEGGADHQVLHLQVADPLVNQFPGDWITTINPDASDITLRTNDFAAYTRGGSGALDEYFSSQAAPFSRVTMNFNGDNLPFRPSGGGDPLSIWLPPQDDRIPKLARFPSVGALFSVRTGVFPDSAVTDFPPSEQHGVPFRSLNMSPSTQSSQSTDGAFSYPDWAMLDLFQVPFLPQRPYLIDYSNPDAHEPFRRLTYGGATVGRININNPSVPYPFSEDIDGVVQTPPQRNALKALFKGLRPSNLYENEEPIYTTIDDAESERLAQAIAQYQATNGPFFMAGQIANVPEIAEYLYTGVATASISRNDVVRDTIGAITTRSNVYSIWVVAQTIRKIPANTDYGVYQPGDVVTSQVRRRFLVERHIDTGKDGVPGNAPGNEVPNAFRTGQVPGDPVDEYYHPSMQYPLPYQWRVIKIEDFPL